MGACSGVAQVLGYAEVPVDCHLLQYGISARIQYLQHIQNEKLNVTEKNVSPKINKRQTGKGNKDATKWGKL
jgi:hypothetical protein